jgi:tRNA pseudouridine55 synthase
MHFQDGEILLVDKPLGWTSFQVVNKLHHHIKRKLGVKKIKIGHAGTLDPLASGLLIVCTGKFTKKIADIQIGTKEYTGKILLGKSTPSFDLETDFDQTAAIEHIDTIAMEKVRNSFLGEQLQTPPIFSAKKIDGKKAYDLARAGKEVEMRKSLIEIFNFELNTSHFPEISFIIQCSKGTYIRSVAHDFGKKLNSLGTLIELRRTKSGEFSINEAKSVDEWIEIIERISPN